MILLHSSPAVSIFVSIVSVSKATIVKVYLTFKKPKKLVVVVLVSAKYLLHHPIIQSISLPKRKISSQKCKSYAK